MLYLCTISPLHSCTTVHCIPLCIQAIHVQTTSPKIQQRQMHTCLRSQRRPLKWEHQLNLTQTHPNFKHVKKYTLKYIFLFTLKFCKTVEPYMYNVFTLETTAAPSCVYVTKCPHMQLLQTTAQFDLHVLHVHAQRHQCKRHVIDISKTNLNFFSFNLAIQK